jgi:hypothetical protein
MMTIAYILFMITAFSCVSFKLVEKSKSEYNFWDDDDISYGYWGFENPLGDGCISHDKEDLDTLLEVGRSVGVIGSILGAFAIILVLVMSCATYPPGVLSILGKVMAKTMGLLTMVLISGLLTDSCFDDNYMCLPGATGYLLVPAFVLWIAATIPLCYCMTPHLSHRVDSLADGERPNPVGTSVVASQGVEQAIHADDAVEIPSTYSVEILDEKAAVDD